MHQVLKTCVLVLSSRVSADRESRSNAPALSLKVERTKRRLPGPRQPDKCIAMSPHQPRELSTLQRNSQTPRPIGASRPPSLEVGRATPLPPKRLQQPIPRQAPVQ